MSIQKRSKFGRRNSQPGSRVNSSPVRGFTLIELLVVVAIIAVLISILLPGLAGAREQARTVVCGEQLGGIGKGMHLYFTENEDWIPSANTSGVELRAAVGSIPGMYNSKMPVQSYDWMTPSVAYSVELPAVRAKRFRELVNRYKCPSQAQYRSVLYGLASCQDRPDIEAEPQDWTSISYLMPIHFQMWGQRHRSTSRQGTGSTDTVLGYSRVNPSLPLWAATAPPDWEALHETYRSRLGEVGTPAQKIAAADGTRYMVGNSPSGDVLDFDISPNPGNSPRDPGLFGSFTSSGAWWGGGTAYGVRQGTRTWTGQTQSYNQAGAGKNLELSYRHGNRVGSATAGNCQQNRGKISAMMFDGAVKLLSDRQSRNVTLWYPRGTTVRDLSNTMIQEMPVGWQIP